MNMEKLLTVIVPVYNVERYLRECIDSLLCQTYSNLEIILSDDGSKDGSAAICEEYAARDSRVKVIHKENGGCASARNAALNIARGEYITFADSDDWLASDAYEAMMALIEKYNVKLVCAGRFDVTDGATEKGLCPVKEAVISGMELAKRIFLWDNADSSPCDKIFHRSIFRELRFPEGVSCDDIAVVYKTAIQAGEAAMLPRPVYYYRHRSGSITTSSLSANSFHFSMLTARIYADVRENYPELLPQAKYLRARSILHILLNLEVGREEDRQRFAQQYRDAQKALSEHLLFILTCGHFGLRQKVTALLLALRIYRPLRGLIHR